VLHAIEPGATSLETHWWDVHWFPIYIYIPIGSMYAIYGNIYHQYTPNVRIYTIHGSYGIYIYICFKQIASGEAVASQAARLAHLS
jgi:hypothetical protein